jgi:hypothetical protein
MIDISLLERNDEISLNISGCGGDKLQKSAKALPASVV